MSACGEVVPLLPAPERMDYNELAHYAKSFAELVLSWSCEGVEVYKHEMRGAALLLLERMDTLSMEHVRTMMSGRLMHE